MLNPAPLQAGPYAWMLVCVLPERQQLILREDLVQSASPQPVSHNLPDTLSPRKHMRNEASNWSAPWLLQLGRCAPGAWLSSDALALGYRGLHVEGRFLWLRRPCHLAALYSPNVVERNSANFAMTAFYEVCEFLFSDVRID
jgi:hypothetical protein